MNQVLFHAPDNADEQTKNVSRNLILKSIVGREMTNFKEFSNVNSQLNANLTSTEKIANKLYRIAIKLAWATESLESLIFNGFITKNQAGLAASTIDKAVAEWDNAYKKGELM